MGTRLKTYLTITYAWKNNLLTEGTKREQESKAKPNQQAIFTQKTKQFKKKSLYKQELNILRGQTSSLLSTILRNLRSC